MTAATATGFDTWRPLELPAGPAGEVFRYEEPAAEVRATGTDIEIRIERFTRYHDTVQNFDNGKHLLLAPEPVEVPADGLSRFGVEMAATNLGGDPFDVRDGFLTFNVLDLDQALALDALATGERLLSLYERLFFPGVTTPADAFLHVVDAPLSGVSTRPGQFHRFTIELEPAARRARWLVDDVAVFTAHALPVVPARITLGLGLLTLHPLQGRSVSLRGQGMAGQWRNLTIETGTAS